MAKNIHPATMILLDGFLAYGTHMKIERPGKGCVISSCDGIDPPIVRLKNGSVMKIHSLEEAEAIRKEVDSVLFLGDMLVPFGDFLKSNHPLIPGGWCEEWWLKEVEAKGVVPSESAKSDPLESFDFSRKHGIPLHPNFTFNWENLKKMDIKPLMKWLESGEARFENGKLVEFRIRGSEGKVYLEDLFIEHEVNPEKEVVVRGTDATALLLTLGMLNKEEIKEFEFYDLSSEETPIQDVLQKICNVKIKPKAPTYMGARMGRPEKAKERPMDGSPNVLFPTGSQKNRSLAKIYKTLKSRDGEKTTILELSRFKCRSCNRITFHSKCHACNSDADPQKICAKCNAITDKEIHCDIKTICYDKRPIEIVELIDETKKKLGGMAEDVKGVKGLSNPTRMPERIEKGFLRAKHDVFVFRDGTIRFDATDVPLTHFIPKEIGLTLEKTIELGYTKDYLGNDLKSDDQLIPLRHQDVIISQGGAEYFFRVTKFIDEMLVYVYGMKPFYNLESEEDLIGHMAAGLSPHTSAAALCRIIGITEANVGYAHPYFHTAKRRNCDGDEDCLMMLMDALINFSRKYLGDTRGGTMDTPLVMTSAIDPREVDDEVHCMEMVTSYSLEFYQAAEKKTFPGEIKIKTVKDVLGTLEQFDQIPITHHCSTLDKGVTRTTYVKLDSIPEKIEAQFNLQERIACVDQKDAAERLILSHFIPDLYGNLRSFSRQTFRCVNCNESYRRVPLAGKCTKCGGNLLLTINKGGIKKYLEISKEIVEKYGLPDYMRQRLDLLDKEIQNIFEDDKIKQMGLSDFI
jgi:DNA polymerase II large subunit